MKTIDRSRRNFCYPKKHQEYYDMYWMGGTTELKDRSGEKAFFEDKKDIFILSAIIGYNHKRRESFTEKVPFTADFREYASVIYGIALDEAMDPTILVSKNKKGYIEKLIEEFACGGFEILKKKLETQGQNRLELFEELLDEELNRSGDIELEILGPLL